MNRMACFAAFLLMSACAPIVRSAEPEYLDLSHGEAKVLRYNVSYLPSPDPDAPWFGRSGFIHPVMTPSGKVVTDGFPADHLHQHGLMFAWTSSSYDGRKVDFWNSKARQGYVQHAETISADADHFKVRLEHVDLTGGKPLVVLQETWEIRRVDHPTMNVFDLTSIQSCATDKPLSIREYHYGAMCIRGPVSWLEDPATMKTNEGLGRKEGNHSRPAWVSMHGTLGDEPAGIAAMAHPDNFRGPQPVRLHPNKPYFCFAPMVLGDFQIEPGTDYVSRFRFVAFDGQPDAQELDTVYRQFAQTK